MADIIDAPVVAVNEGKILVDGTLAGTTEDAADLSKLLRAKRELWKQVQPNRPFPGVCLLQIDVEADAAIVKTVVKEVTRAGYANLSFLVHRVNSPARR